MNEQKHTPGPWRYGETPSLDGQGIAFEVDTDDFTVAHVYPTFDSGNAALIAAAPDMYEAVCHMFDLLDGGVFHPDDTETAFMLTECQRLVRAALAKAESR